MLIWNHCSRGTGIFGIYNGLLLAIALGLIPGLVPGVLEFEAIAQLPPTEAPVIPDGTLPNPSTVSTEMQGGNALMQIGGGTATGQNLFHSFERFSVPTDQTVRFVPSGDIARIIARVTGGDGSFIDGTLASSGGAALFLINPNGISFGPNAQLQLGGSFIASTAESMVFADGAEFRTGVNGNSTPLLTSTVPLGLQLGAGSGDITGVGRGRTDTPGLTLAPGQTLGLLGRSLDFAGVAIAAPSGDFQAGAVTSGTVGLDSNLQLNYDNVDQFGDLTLREGSFVRVTTAVPQVS
ncbi:MAG: filamentous hemagglutinin N-terminal domain-containing protein, partial [Cyanobacteria bacterium P01_D01_bin.73]